VRYSILVALREYLENVKTKGFWIGILLFPVLLIASIAVPRLLDKFAKPTRNFCVVDPSGEFTPVIDATLKADYEKRSARAAVEYEQKRKADPKLAAFDPPKPPFRRVAIPEGALGQDPEQTRKNLKPWLTGDKKILVDGKEEELFALVSLPPLALSVPKGSDFWCVNLADTALADLIEAGLKDELKSRKLVEKGVTKKDVDSINETNVEFQCKDPKKAEGEEKVSKAEKIRQWAPVAFVYMLFVAIMTVAQMLLSSTIEEKSTRIVEVLLSSVTPWELMLGKLLGVALVGLTMLVAWLTSAFLVFGHFIQQGDENARIFLNLMIEPGLLLPFLALFLLGYLMYSSVLLAVGSTCNTLKEAQNFMGPVMTVLMVPLLTMIFVAQDPNGMLATVLTWVPFFTPFVLMNRMAGNPPTAEVVGGFALIIASVVFAIWFSGRIFRNGILRTGQPPKLLEFLKLARKA
jgi:ABC-2 type transport system permease protein